MGVIGTVPITPLWSRGKAQATTNLLPVPGKVPSVARLSIHFPSLSLPAALCFHGYNKVCHMGFIGTLLMAYFVYVILLYGQQLLL